MAPRGRVAGRVAWPTILALTLTLALATDTLALTWRTNTALTTAQTGWAMPGSLAVSSSTTAHAVLERRVLGDWHVLYHRTTNSGSTWASAVRLSRLGAAEAGSPVIDAYGSGVNAAWLEGDDIVAGLDTIVSTRRSADSGASWTDPYQLSPANESAGPPRIARYGNLVAVVWTDQLTGRIYLRRSSNGGSTWAARQLVGTTTNRPYASSRSSLLEGFPAVAVASGLLYVTYFSATRTLRVRASTNSGATLKSPITLASNAAGWAYASVAAKGSTVVVGFAGDTRTDNWTVVRRSTDKGAHWSKAVSLNAASSYWSSAPVITVRGSRWMAVYERCSSSSCGASYTYYRASTNGGSTWSSPTVASVRKTKWGAPADVDVATRTIVLYNDYSTSANDVYVRGGW